mmetsp:Transcript_63141/g.135567  ORF Transcript_63141/g.135567 Transcript_63141/m.135567 type:complete len:305 (-) Transcript_63141:362-1276(-)
MPPANPRRCPGHGGRRKGQGPGHITSSGNKLWGSGGDRCLSVPAPDSNSGGGQSFGRAIPDSGGASTARHRCCAGRCWFRCCANYLHRLQGLYSLASALSDNFTGPPHRPRRLSRGTRRSLVRKILRKVRGAPPAAQLGGTTRRVSSHNGLCIIEGLLQGLARRVHFLCKDYINAVKQRQNRAHVAPQLVIESPPEPIEEELAPALRFLRLRHLLGGDDRCLRRWCKHLLGKAASVWRHWQAAGGPAGGRNVVVVIVVGVDELQAPMEQARYTHTPAEATTYFRVRRNDVDGQDFALRGESLPS